VIVANAHHRADEVAAFAATAGLTVSREEEILGTAGGLRHAGALLGSGDVLVWNGDMIAHIDVAALLEAHARESACGALATLVVRPRGDAAGNTGLNAAGDVIRLRREGTLELEARTADFLGVYVVTDAIRRRLPPRGDIIAEGLLPAILEGGRLASFAFSGACRDIGSLEAYLEANLDWLARRGTPSWAGEAARVAPTTVLRGVVVGARASVTGEGEVRRCVVWPGAVLRAPLANAIVATEGIVRVTP
jgi:NDP-sugar pyrophosphorylase family protein